MRATEIVKRPVVTLSGEDVAQVKDVVYAADRGTLAGFTLNGRGLLAGPLKTSLPWSAVHGLGRDAVMIGHHDALVPRDDVLAHADSSGRDVLGSRVLTDDGTDLGTVVDVIIGTGGTTDVVGYEIDSSEALGKGGRKVLIPLPDTLAVSGENLILPAAARDFVTDDLAGFGAAVEEFRKRLHGSSTLEGSEQEDRHEVQ